MARSVDWTAVEKLLVERATTELATFAAAHATEVFYGAVFDVESYDGASVTLLLNTEEHLRASYDEDVDEDDLHRRFLPGGFAHSLELSETDDFPTEAIEAAVEADIDDNNLDDDGLHVSTARLLEVVCNVAHTLEHGALTQLKRTAGFTIAVTPDAREPGEMSVARYAKFKKALNARRRSDPSLLKPPKPGV